MQQYNTVPKRGTFGEAVDVINENFSITSVAIGEIELATRKNKGLFRTGEALWASVPHPEPGDWALVGESFPASIYACDTAGEWDYKGTYAGDNLELNNYISKSDFALLSSSVKSLGKKMDAIDTSAVKSREESQGDGEIQIGGVTMVTKTQSQWENMGGSYADNTLYVVVEN